jgi:FkbM family methyltransferase
MSDLKKAIAHFNRGDKKAAESGFRAVLAREPANTDALNNLGVVFKSQGKLREALECYARALWLKPDNPEVYRNAGNALRDAGAVDAAVACYVLASQLLRGVRRAADAVAAAQLATRLRPNANSRLELGLALIRQEKYKEAGAQLTWVTNETGRIAALARFLGEGKDVAEVKAGRSTLRFRVRAGSANLGLGSFHVNGELYEQAELERCRELVKPGAVIVDVGANIGNHLVYFAKVMKAKKVIPVEPHPEAIRQLLDNVALNAITCVDKSCLGRGAGEKRGRFKLVESVDLAQASLVPAAAGEIEVAPLDELIKGPVDLLKIDVERLELGVLKGARGLLAKHRPLMLVEVADPNLAAFRAMLPELRYAVKAEFEHRGYRNVFLAPAK